MNIGVASHKGGVGKTTTAIHLAQVLAGTGGETVLFDSDRIRTATNWEKRGRKGGHATRFHVLPIEAAQAMSRNYQHTIVDTGQQPGTADLLVLAQYSDLLILPTSPSTFDADGLSQTINALRQQERPDGSMAEFRVLFTRVSHHHGREVDDLREFLGRNGVPMFDAEVPELKAFERSAERGVLVRDVADDQRAEVAWKAYEAVGAQMLQVLEAAHVDR